MVAVALEHTALVIFLVLLHGAVPVLPVNLYARPAPAGAARSVTSTMASRTRLMLSAQRNRNGWLHLDAGVCWSDYLDVTHDMRRNIAATATAFAAPALPGCTLADAH